MSTFCRITGRSRGLPKPNYFPLLPPISPADAKRFCRITGKSYGLPAHHYIPVLVSTKPKKKAAQAPIPLIGQENGIQTKSHVLVADYRYVFPVCEDSSDLVQLLDGKNIESKAHYIYKVAERRCSLVFSAKMEAAVRDGDIRNVMLAKDSDTLLLKLRKGGDVAIDVRDISIEGLDIYDGEGPSEEVVNQRKKRKRKENSVMSTVGKIFEEKERVAEIEEEKDKKKQKVLKKESANDVSKAKTDVKRQKWNDVKPEPLDIVVTASSEELSPLFENNNWSNFDETFQNKGRPVVDKMPSPCVLEPEVVDLSTSLPGLIQAPAVLDSTTGLEVVSAVNPISPLIVEPDLELQNCIKKLDSSELEKTADAKQVFSRDKHNLNMLPTILEIPELLEHLKEGTHSTIGSSQCQVSGLKLDIHTASKFIVGVTVETPNGPVFVPGQTVNTPNGEQFVPGITIKTPEGVPQLLPGQIFDVKDESGMKQPVFVAGQVLNTREGETFVPGQKVETKDGPKFVPGQTIMTEDSLKFVPGQIIRSEGHEEPQFVPGITELDCDGHKFVPGQMHTDQYGQISFVPGQSELAEEGWNFVPGQSVTTSTGDVKFVPGQVVNSKDGPTFIPGQTVKTKFGDNQFVPGVVVEGEEGTKFVPGAAIKTADGPQFVEGQLFRSSSGKMHFIPGVTEVSEEGTFEFAAARHVSDIVTRDSSSLGISIQNAVINTTDKSDTVYGHMVQTRQGVEFFPGVASGLPAGKVVPGRLVRGKEVKFVPGVMIDDKFVPGQVVTTENGEQFVPGQVVETKDGAKFVPGQVIDTRSGPKFVPGQTVETPEGPKFVPGQIVETKAGPTFIPGQVISTDDGGSRFVPGQVVETIEGPRFVPGRVVETGDKVSFVPGQVVETSEGLKFIAPDLENDSQGDVQFTVQGFEITPEELSLLRPQINTNSIFAPTSSEMSIDSRMMRQLSEAGMAVGKQVPAEVPKVDVRTVPAMGVACSLRDRLPGNIDPVTTIKLSQILAAVADFDCTIPINGSEIVDTPKEGIILKAMMKAAAQADTELALYKNVCAVLEKALLLEDRDEIIPIVDNLHKFVLHSPKLELMRPKKKMQVLKDVIVGNVSSEQEIIDKLSYILKDGEASVLEGFKNFTKGCPEIVGKIVQRMTDTLDKIENEKDASESLQKAIIEVVRESSDISIHNVLNNATGDNVKNMFLEAIGLARAMGMREVASTLLCVLADPRKAELLVNDRVTFEILRRLTVMRHLAEKRPKFGTALLQLKTDPDEARSDPLVRELVRESGALMIIPEETKIQSAGDIPISLIANNNSLAMEDFMLKNKKHGILVIVKHGIQCVIPREACRAVLTGKVPYTVLDERGMHTFAPLHVFSALHIPQMYTHRFSMYSVSTEEEAPTLGTITPASAASVEDVSTLHSSQHKDTADKEGGDVIFSANQDYLSSDLDSLSLHRGEQVIVLDTVGGNLSTAKQSELDADLNLGGEVTSLLDNSAARHKLAVRPRKRYTGSRHRDISPSVPEQQRWLVQSIEDPGRQGWVPATVLSTHEDSPDDMKPNDAKFNRDVVVRELIETEEEFGRDIQQVIDAYLKPLDSPSVPRVVRDNKDVIFGNLKKISEFHNTTLIEGLRYYAEQPKMLGKTFLRLERDFDKHVAYCRDEPAAQDFFLDNDEARDYFEELSQQLGDDKSLSEHLKLPVQRINDYQLLLRELVKYSTRLGEDTTDLGKALELMLAVPHRANDNKFISNIEGYHGNIHKLGRLLRHDWFCVTDRDGKSKERYLFLFKARILICKVRRISEDRSVFVLKDIIRLPEVEVKDHKEDPKVYELHHKQPDFGSYPLKLAAHKDRIKDAWLAEIRQYATDVLALAEHAADDLRLQPSVENKRLEPLQGIHIEPATPDQVIPLEPRDSEAKPQKSVLPKRYSPEAEKKPKEEKVEEKPEPQKPKAVEKQEEPKKIEPAKPPEPSGEKRKEEEPDLPVDKKVKFEEQEMDSHSSSISRRASTRKVVSTEEYRSVSSSQEVYMESSSTRSSTSAGMSSSRSMKIIEESASVNGRTVASSREVIGGGSGYSAIQEVSSGGVTIEEISSKQGSSRLDERRRSSGPKPVFTKTIEGMRVQPGGNAFFECELDEKAKVIWLKDNKPLEDKWADRITAVSSDTKHRLEIKGAHENDTGLYTARAEDNRGVSSCTARLLVEHFTESQGKAGGSKEPEFTISLHDTELLENTYLRFMVKVRGDPKPDVKFYKNDRLITVANERIEIIKTNADKGYYELVIPDVQQEDAGTYKCIASNIHGEVESEGVVTVTDDKKLFEGLEDAELLQPGEQPNFTWLRDGKPFDPEDRFKVLFKDEEDSLALVFQHVKPEDAGLYTCVASTSTGKISCSAELTVQGEVREVNTDSRVSLRRSTLRSVNQLMREPQKPKLSTEVKKTESAIGGTAMLELKVEGFPKPDVKWSHDGKDITAGGRYKFLHDVEEESMSLVIKNVEASDAGDYKITASNELGEDHDTVHLMVKAPPKFKTKLSDVSCMASAEIKLKVQVEGCPQPDVKWYKDGKVITKSDCIKTYNEADATYELVIDKASLDDAGAYSVVATNELSQTSEFCKVEVHSPPEFIKTMTKHIETSEGDTVTFQVKVRGDPMPSVKWLKDGVVLKSDGSHIQISEDGATHTLVVHGINRKDTGKYSCEISNTHGTTRDDGDMFVKCCPQFRQKLSDQKANEGDTNIEFTVNIEAFPKPQVKWFHNEVEITEKKTEFTRIEEGDNYKLIIKEVTTELSGKYSVKVVNDLGKEESTSKFTVYSKPRFSKPLPSEIKVDEGASLTLQIEVEGTPDPAVKWYKNGQEVTGDAHIKISRDSQRVENYNMTFTLVKVADGGEYEVRASNEMGTSVTKTTVLVQTQTSMMEGDATEAQQTPEPAKKAETEEVEKPKPQAAKTATTEEAVDEVVEEKKAKTDIVEEPTRGTRDEIEEVTPKEQEKPKTVEVEAAPEILSADMNDRTVYESLSTVFEVEAKGVPRPEAKWYKENEELKVDDHTKISEQGQKYRLELRNIKVADAGYYKCKVVNRLGEKVQTAQLSVLTEAALREPKFKTPLKPQEVPKGQDVTFTAVVTGDPIPEVKWTKDGEDISVRFTLASTDKEVKDGLKECTFTLKIPAGRHEDTGEYKVTAFNKWGSADSSARLDMVFRPEIICYKDTTCTPYEQVELIANILANPRPNITWLAGNKVVKDDEHSVMDNNTKDEVYKLILKNVGVDDENVYTVKASNNVGESEAKAKLTVHTEKPSLLKQLDGQTIKDYHPVEFKIRAIGIPKPQISWYKDDKKLVSDGHIVIEDATEGQACSTLSIGHFCHADVGQYTVKAANLAGEAESSASLKMAQIPPSFSKTLDRSIDLAEADPLELRAKVDGSPMPQVKWLKDGEPLEPSDRVKISVAPDGSVKLNIDSVKPTDCGAYKLMAINENGESSSICAVAVAPEARQPQFTKGLTDTAAVEGEPLRLEAQVAAFPTPEVKWTKDGHPVRPSPHVIMSTTPAGVLTLAIDKVKPEDAGTYEVAVSNRLGDTSSNAKVDVKQKEKKPQFLAQLQPVTVVEGFPAKMEVKVVGHPPPTIAWSLNGKPLVPDGKHVKIVDGPDGSQTLLIDNATPADAGTYSVTVKNPQGEVTSQAPLSVTARAKTDAPEQAPSLPKGLRDAVADEDSPLVFSAPFLGNPVPGVVWSKDGTPLQSGDRVAITCDGNKIGLEINPCKPEDAGTYSVMLTNPLGEVKEEAKGTVRKIYQRPLFTQKFNDLQQLPNYDAKLMARVTGTPKPDVTWYKGDTRLSDSDKYRLKRDGDAVYLYVQDCCLDDSGVYKCVATNREGEDTCQAELEVVDKLERKPKAEPPVFLKKIGDCEVFKGMTAKFTACAMGYPEPEAEWFRGNDKLFPSERIRMEREGTGLLRLSIIGVDPALDVGQYKCRIYNPHGEETCDAHMIYDSLDVRPRKPIGEQYVDFDKFQKTGAPLPLSDRPIISRMTDRRLTLSWKPSIPIGPRDPVTYQVEMCELPSGEWFTARTGVRSCACDIANLEPFRDYKFRIRVENKYGVSDPSPFAQTYRQKLEPDPPKFIPYLPPGIDFRPETSPYFPKDFDIERPPHDGYAQAPKFLRQEHDCQYGVKNHNCNLFWFVYGYPKPKMTYFFNDEPIEMGGRYDSSYTRNGQATLFINKMLERDVGMYEAVATNEHGMARQRVRLEIAEYPEFLQRPDETIVMVRRSGRIEARVIGVPYPEIKWYKDWQPLASSSRIKMLQHLINIFPGSGQSSENSGNGKIQHIEPDLCILIINDAITKDEGLYSISARNIAGSVSSSVMVRVEESESDYGYLTYGKGRNVKPKIKPLGEFYDLGDELGRGTQGITYHSVERLSGRNYAAKIMHGKGELRGFMRNELEMMNMLNHRKLIRLYDAYESPHTFTLVTEIAAGGELLYNLTKQTFVTESEIAGYIRQILWGLEHMHDQNIAHLGLTPGDLLISHPGGDDLKICDFGLARRIAYNRLASLEYGMPEFVAPEIVKGEGVSFPADMWSVGVITHLLLTGISLFRGQDDRTTLTNIKENKWEFREDIWKYLSIEARDFITKLLVFDAEGRMDVKAALRHPWLNSADKMPSNQHSITTDTLRNYYNLLKDWYANASCRTWYRRMPLDGAFTHPSRMVYPPGRAYTPDPTPPPEQTSKAGTPRTWEDQIPSRKPLDYELCAVKSESHYQNGPDTYLLQLRDVDFPVRLREYMKVAAERCPLSRGNYHDRDNPHVDWRTPVIRERRRFTDVMDEEIDDERKERINRYGSPDMHTLRRIRHELGTRLDSHVEAEALMAARRDGMAPFFREKPQTLPVEEDKPAELVCFAVGDPRPVVQWFKNDMVLTESHRIKIQEDDFGRSILRFNPAHASDIGIYKVTARNKSGQTVVRCRVVLAETPHAPDSPDASDISDTEILLRWKQPKCDGNSPVVCYSVQCKESDAVDWIDLASNIDHEFYLVRDLKPNTSYQFRLASKNKIGWSEKGIPTKAIKTSEPGVPKIQMSRAMKHLQDIVESGQEVVHEEQKSHLEYKVEKNPIHWSHDQPTEKYNYISEISRGRFSVVVKGIDKSNDRVVVAKLLEYRPDTEVAVDAEFEAYRSLRHERIACLIEAYKPSNAQVAVFIEEKLQGVDVLTYLSNRHEYTEQTVANIITQVLDGLQYLHWRGFCHLDLQPDNVVMLSVRSVQVKLVDFGATQRVSKIGTVVKSLGHPEFTAPEVLSEEAAYPQTDIWSVGVLTYVLLSGVSPFRGANKDETRQNINFVRFRFEHLYKELTQEATRFIMLVFKRHPHKRPTAEECHEHRWLLPTEYMIKRRERAVFLGNRLKEYSEQYHNEKATEITKFESLTSAVRSLGPNVTRSNSIVEEILSI
ncbi:obscurin-like isoform X6 [Macrosteles quadrilineatus]|uniref:obscurin-like isoform X6 n=1 Tax=Macrosteles quadrilineatus TaxID=74068 RepID=UPI0023E14274|nr:obscurin-like isoform X6 [Macrosteles quadrilineatus]